MKLTPKVKKSERKFPITNTRKIIDSEKTRCDSEDSSGSIILRPRKRKRYLIISDSSSTDVSDGEKKSLIVHNAPSEKQDFAVVSQDDNKDYDKSEILCRGVCDIDSYLWDSDNDGRKWIQCEKCMGWWHQIHAKLDCMEDEYIQELSWCCEMAGFLCEQLPSNYFFSFRF